MAPRPPLLSLRGARVTFGGPALFVDVSLGIGRGDRLCLVGRNGCGKSTLMKVLSGEVGLDGGERFVAPGARIAYMPQEARFTAGETVAAFVAGGLGGDEPGDGDHLVDEILGAVGLDGERRAKTLSGGEGRRAALARALVGAPDILLLDEPTNHLDLPSIEWLEGRLARFRGGILLVSHDRALLARIARGVLWLERGTLRRLDAGIGAFEDWSAEVLAAEENEARRRDVQIAADLRYQREGLTARRRRNRGRLRRLARLREERRQWIARPGRPALAVKASGGGARLVIEAEEIAKSFATPEGPRVVVKGFSTRVMRGDRVGLIGPNGAGKTTLLRMLSGDLAPDAGRLRLGAGVAPLYFDQTREALDPEATLWQTLAGEGDQVVVRGRPRHVVSYLRDYLFEERQALSPVKSLSGGERNRLLLARLFARPGNLLVLDEPTNDLDMETLDLLEEVLGDYDGTLLVASHDRDFLDRIVTSVIAVEGGGEIVEYAGGYSDYLVQRRAGADATKPGAVPKARAPAAPRRTGERTVRLSYKDRHELDKLPARIDALAMEIRELEARLADPALYGADRATFDAASARLAEARAELAGAEERWLELETKREAIEEGPPPRKP